MTSMSERESFAREVREQMDKEKDEAQSEPVDVPTEANPLQASDLARSLVDVFANEIGDGVPASADWERLDTRIEAALLSVRQRDQERNKLKNLLAVSMKHLVDYREWMLKELRDAGGWKMEMRDDAEALTTFITQVDAALSTPDAPPAFGPCTHCNTAPAVESNLEGTVRLCAGCTKLRANEAWSSQTGLPQEGENCERFQGKETAT